MDLESEFITSSAFGEELQLMDKCILRLLEVLVGKAESVEIREKSKAVSRNKDFPFLIL